MKHRAISFNKIILFLLLIPIIISTCKGTATVNGKSSAKDIVSFTILDIPGTIGANTVAITVPYGTDPSSLTPTIDHTGASVSPESEVARDFTTPQTYTVTAADNSTKDYTITVTVAPSDAKDIISFTILGIAGTVGANTVALTVPYGTDRSSLTPTIAITGSSVNPASGVAHNFSTPQTYTVTAADSSTKDYTVTITVAPFDAKDITSFAILGVGGTIGANTITLTVPYGTDRSSLTPTITITGASVNPASGVAHNFTTPQTYTVTAADSSTKDYTVTVTVALSPAKDITAFSILGIDGTIGTNSVALTVPYGTDTSSLTPTITITGASVNPASGVAHNFTTPQTYTVTAADSSTKDYTVTVTVALSPAKDITAFSILGIAGTIGTNTVALTVPYGTDRSSLTPTIVHTGASVNPASGVAHNFTTPQTYTVTAADSTTKDYTVTVTISNYAWTKRMGGTDGDFGYAIAIDSGGNIYVAGNFGGTVNFAADFGGTDNKTSAGGQDIFITKINSNGTYGWTKRMGGTGQDFGYAIAIDNSDNVYITGGFFGTVNFAEDFGGTDNKTSAGSVDIFITKINSNGTYGWTKRMGGTGDERGYAVAIDSNGNIYITGSFEGTVNFAADFGGTDIGISKGYTDIFITKINFINHTYTYGWTKRIGGTGSDKGYAVAIDNSDNIYITGGFAGTVDFAWGFSHLTDNKTSAGGQDIFIAKIGGDGTTYYWTSRMGGTSYDEGYAIAIDNSGNVYITGGFFGTVNFAEDFGGTDNKTSAGITDISISKINSNGTYGWTKRMGGTGQDFGYAIAIDGNGNIFITGYFEDTVNFAEDFGGTDSKTSAGSRDIFITTINSNGTYGWTRRMGGIDSGDCGKGVTTDSNDNIYITGYFEGTVNFAEDFVGTDSKTSTGSGDIFITKIGY